jgi:hypothetical protein
MPANWQWATRHSTGGPSSMKTTRSSAITRVPDATHASSHAASNPPGRRAAASCGASVRFPWPTVAIAPQSGVDSIGCQAHEIDCAWVYGRYRNRWGDLCLRLGSPCRCAFPSWPKIWALYARGAGQGAGESGRLRAAPSGTAPDRTLRHPGRLPAQACVLPLSCDGSRGVPSRCSRSGRSRSPAW